MKKLSALMLACVLLLCAFSTLAEDTEPIVIDVTPQEALVEEITAPEEEAPIVVETTDEGTAPVALDEQPEEITAPALTPEMEAIGRDGYAYVYGASLYLYRTQAMLPEEFFGTTGEGLLLATWYYIDDASATIYVVFRTEDGEEVSGYVNPYLLTLVSTDEAIAQIATADDMDWPLPVMPFAFAEAGQIPGEISEDDLQEIAEQIVQSVENHMTTEIPQDVQSPQEIIEDIMNRAGEDDVLTQETLDPAEETDEAAAQDIVAIIGEETSEEETPGDENGEEEPSEISEETDLVTLSQDFVFEATAPAELPHYYAEETAQAGEETITLYTFTDYRGQAQYRVHGVIGEAEGFFEADAQGTILSSTPLNTDEDPYFEAVAPVDVPEFYQVVTEEEALEAEVIEIGA